VKIIRKIKAELPLRLGLGLTYAYSGYDILKNPNAWTQFTNKAVINLPEFMRSFIQDSFGVTEYLRVQGIFEIIIAVLLLSWFLPARVLKWVGLIVAIEAGLILSLVGTDTITFRDISILGAGLALFIMATKKASIKH